LELKKPTKLQNKQQSGHPRTSEDRDLNDIDRMLADPDMVRAKN